MQRSGKKGPYVKINDSEKAELPYERITLEDVPEDCGLDKYGLIVRKEFAIKVKTSLSDQILDGLINSEAETPNRSSPRPRSEYQPTAPVRVLENSPLSPSLPLQTSQSSIDTSQIDALDGPAPSAWGSDTTASIRPNSPGSTSHRSEAVDDSEDSSENADDRISADDSGIDINTDAVEPQLGSSYQLRAVSQPSVHRSMCSSPRKVKRHPKLKSSAQLRPLSTQPTKTAIQPDKSLSGK